MTVFRKFATHLVHDTTPDNHVGHLGEITYKDGYLYYHDGQTPGGTLINGGGSGGPVSWASITGKPTFATVATSGSYNDLTNKPTIPSDVSDLTDTTNLLFSGDYNDLSNKPTLFSGSYIDLINKPAIPSDVSDLTDTTNLLFSGDYNDLLNTPDLSVYQLASSAFSGDYNDLINKPSIPDLTGYATESWVLSQGYGSGSGSTDRLTNGSYNFILEPQGYLKVPTSQYSTAQIFSNAGVDLLLGTLDSGNFWQLKSNGSLVFPDYSIQTTAYTGDYNDLTNKPTIPSDTNQLINSAGFITLSDLPAPFSGDYGDLTNTPDLSVYQLASAAFSGDYNDLTNKPTLIRSAPQWTANHTLADGTRYLAGDVVYDNGNIFLANYDNESLPTSNATYWLDLGPGNRINIDGRDIPNIQYSQIANTPTLFSGDYNDLTNKPVIPDLTGYATETYVDTAISDLVNGAGPALDTLNELAAALGDDSSFAVTVANSLAAKANSADLAAVATSGDYNDLINTPDLSVYQLASTAFSGSYNDLTNLPALFSGDYNDLTNKPTLFSGAYADLIGAPSLATVATSGDYNDLINKPTLFSGDYNDLTNTPTIPSDVSDLTDTTNLLFSGDYNDLINKPTLFSGSYNDLTNTPTIPDSILDLNIVDGTNGQVLTTDGAGGFNFTTVAAGSLNARDVTRVYSYVTNADSVTIQKGQPVYMFAAAGDRVSVKLASNLGDATSAKTLGLADEAIAPGNPGYICTQGVVTNLDTSSYAEGDTLYLGATAGTLTNVKPHAPNHLVYIGVVERTNAGNGLIYVRPQNGYELDEIHDVNLIDNPPADGDVLTYDSASELWVAAAPFSGDYNDLTNTPNLFSGDYDDLTNKPDLSVYQLASTAFSGSYNDLTNLPALFSGDYNDLINTPTLFSGDYNDLTNKPSIPSTTTDIAEGVNLYYTDTRARSSISVTDSGGDGSLSYNNSTGVITYTGPSATEVRAHFSAGTGITITNGSIATTITQYTDALARAAISVSGSLSYNSSTGVISYTAPTAVSQLTNDSGYLTSIPDESFESKSSATGTVTHDCATNKVFIHSSVSADFTANLTNLNLSAGKATAITLIINQGATPYVCNALQIGGSAQTINWQGSTSAPAGNASKKDAISFSIFNVSGTYTVLGQLVSFG